MSELFHSQFQQHVQQLQTTGTGIKGVCDWMVKNAGDPKVLVAAWREAVVDPQSQVDLLFRLLNLVLRKDPALVSEFRSVMEEAVKAACRRLAATGSPSAGSAKIHDHISVWQAEELFGATTSAHLKRVVEAELKLNQLRDVFPGEDEELLRTALAKCKSTEAAVEYLYQLEKTEDSSFASGSITSWADEVDSEFPEAETPQSAQSAAQQRASYLDQFAHRANQAIRGLPTAKQLSKPPVKYGKPGPVPVARPLITSPVKLSPRGKPTCATSSADLVKPDDSLRAEHSDNPTTKALEARLLDLERQAAGQQAEIDRLSRSEQRLDSFVRELRQEFGRLLQRQLNVERGVGSAGQLAANPHRRFAHRGSGMGGHRVKSLNPDAAPWSPLCVESASSSTADMTAETASDGTELDVDDDLSVLAS